MIKPEIKKLIDDERDINNIAGLTELDSGSSLKKALSKKIEKLRDDLSRDPVISNTVKLDMRYKLGFIEGLIWAKELPEEFKNIKNKKQEV